MAIDQCKGCEYATKCNNDTIIWWVCEHYDLYIDRVLYCGIKKEKHG